MGVCHNFVQTKRRDCDELVNVEAKIQTRICLIQNLHSFYYNSEFMVFNKGLLLKMTPTS